MILNGRRKFFSASWRGNASGGSLFKTSTNVRAVSNAGRDFTLLTTDGELAVEHESTVQSSEHGSNQGKVNPLMMNSVPN